METYRGKDERHRVSTIMIQKRVIGSDFTLEPVGERANAIRPYGIFLFGLLFLFLILTIFLK